MKADICLIVLRDVNAIDVLRKLLKPEQQRFRRTDISYLKCLEIAVSIDFESCTGASTWEEVLGLF